jgi:hypothetical protein
MLPLFYPRKPRPHRKRPAPAPAPAVAATVVEVTGSFGDDQTVWTFDRPVTILPGATFAMFSVRDEAGAQTCLGVSAVQLTSTTIRILMNAAIEDFGNGWFWELLSVPPKVKTTDGADVTPGEGDLQLS